MRPLRDHDPRGCERQGPRNSGDGVRAMTMDEIRNLIGGRSRPVAVMTLGSVVLQLAVADAVFGR